MIADLFWLDGNGPFVWGAWFAGGVLLKLCLAQALHRDWRTRRRLESLAGPSPQGDER